MNEWHPIDETAPENTEIIIWDPVRHDWFKAWSSDSDWQSLNGDGVIYHNPTHWMLGPMPPEEKVTG